MSDAEYDGKGGVYQGLDWEADGEVLGGWGA